jgi:hypothetical protein
MVSPLGEVTIQKDAQIRVSKTDDISLAFGMILTHKFDDTDPCAISIH